MGEKKKFKRNLPALVLFLIVVQIFAVFLTYAFKDSNIEVPAYAPFGNTTVEQAVLNAVALLIPVVVITLLFIVFLKIFGINFFKAVIMFLSISIVFLLNSVFAYAILANYLSSLSATVLSYSLTAVLMAIVVYSFVRYNPWLSNMVTFIIAAEIGSLFAITLSPPTLFVIPIAFLLYDIYAVFFGPLKIFIKEFRKGEKVKKIRKGREGKGLNLGVLIANVGGFSIGSGDLFFYSLLVSSAFVLGGIFNTFFVMLAVNIGILINLLLLVKYETMLPGLPIPLALGLITLLFFWYI
jgi:hypothetical protein